MTDLQKSNDDFISDYLSKKKESFNLLSKIVSMTCTIEKDFLSLFLFSFFAITFVFQLLANKTMTFFVENVRPLVSSETVSFLSSRSSFYSDKEIISLLTTAVPSEILKPELLTQMTLLNEMAFNFLLFKTFIFVILFASLILVYKTFAEKLIVSSEFLFALTFSYIYVCSCLAFMIFSYLDSSLINHFSGLIHGFFIFGYSIGVLNTLFYLQRIQYKVPNVNFYSIIDLKKERDTLEKTIAEIEDEIKQSPELLTLLNKQLLKSKDKKEIERINEFFDSFKNGDSNVKNFDRNKKIIDSLKDN